MSFDQIFDLTAGVYFNFYNSILYSNFVLFPILKRGEEKEKTK